MTNEQVYQMPFARVWPLLEQKVLRKGRTSEEQQQYLALTKKYRDGLKKYLEAIL